MYKHLYSNFLNANPERIHFAAHSHHLWPDVTREAHMQYWDDSAKLADNKWEYIFNTVIPQAQSAIASILGLSTPSNICFAPNTHEFVNRLISCFEPGEKLSILTTDGEFHSFKRQIERLKEYSHLTVTEVPVEPFHSFEERFAKAAQQNSFDLVFCSHVFFALGFAIENLDTFVEHIKNNHTITVIDGYHSFCALPTNLSKIENEIFYLAGGYKYAQAGEGACFMHIPKGFSLRPGNTGWYASFGTLKQSQHAQEKVLYADDGFRFWGATFDPSGLYRFNAVMKLFQELGLSVDTIHAYVQARQNYFLTKLQELKNPLIQFKDLLKCNPAVHAHFLTFRFDKAQDVHQILQSRNIVTDVRGTCLRFGFGLYHTDSCIDQLMTKLT